MSARKPKTPRARPAAAKPKGAKARKGAQPKAGRKSTVTPERLQAIGERLGQGEPLTRICKDLKLSDRTVRDWMANDPAIAADIARAREEGEQAIAHRLRRVAAGERAAEGQPPLSSGDVQRDKLIIDTDLKLLAKFNPKRWGDKVQHADAEGEKLPAPQFVVMPIAALPVED